MALNLVKSHGKLTPPISATATILDDRECITIGRMPSARLNFKSDFISRNHAVIERDPGTDDWYLVPQKQTSRTYIEGVHIKPGSRTLLQEGNLIQFGTSSIKADYFIYRFSVPSPANPQPSTSATIQSATLKPNLSVDIEQQSETITVTTQPDSRNSLLQSTISNSSSNNSNPQPTLVTLSSDSSPEESSPIVVEPPDLILSAANTSALDDTSLVSNRENSPDLQQISEVVTVTTVSYTTTETTSNLVSTTPKSTSDLLISIQSPPSTSYDQQNTPATIDLTASSPQPEFTTRMDRNLNITVTRRVTNSQQSKPTTEDRTKGSNSDQCKQSHEDSAKASNSHHSKQSHEDGTKASDSHHPKQSHEDGAKERDSHHSKQSHEDGAKERDSHHSKQSHEDGANGSNSRKRTRGDETIESNNKKQRVSDSDVLWPSDEDDDIIFVEENEFKPVVNALNKKVQQEKDRELSELRRRLKDLEAAHSSKLSEMELKLKQTEEEKRKIATEGTSTDVRERFNELLEEGLNCSICSEIFTKPKTLNPCSHIYCTYCIDTWLTKKRECPICRAKVISAQPFHMLESYISKAVETLSEEKNVRRQTILKERDDECAAQEKEKKGKAKACSYNTRSSNNNSDNRNGASTSANNRTGMVSGGMQQMAGSGMSHPSQSNLPAMRYSKSTQDVPVSYSVLYKDKPHLLAAYLKKCKEQEQRLKSQRPVSPNISGILPGSHPGPHPYFSHPSRDMMRQPAYPNMMGGRSPISPGHQQMHSNQYHGVPHRMPSGGMMSAGPEPQYAARYTHDPNMIPGALNRQNSQGGMPGHQQMLHQVRSPPMARSPQPTASPRHSHSPHITNDMYGPPVQHPGQPHPGQPQPSIPGQPQSQYTIPQQTQQPQDSASQYPNLAQQIQQPTDSTDSTIQDNNTAHQHNNDEERSRFVDGL